MKTNDTVAIVCGEGEVFFALEAARALGERVGAPVIGDTEPCTAGEIVIGDTSRDITKTAKALLDEKREDGKSGYLIYSDGESAAIVWTDFQLAEIALSALPEELPKGYEHYESIDLIDYLKERDGRIRAQRWQSLEAAIPEEYRAELTQALREFYSLFDYEPAIDWLAGLYDPDTGGFYGSYSARNTEGYLPDIEHTLFGFTVTGHLGMAEMLGGDWAEAIPKDMLVRAAEWIASLQESDGYFYNTQWPKELIERVGFQLRVTRDYGSATTVLKRAGITPKYSPVKTGDGKAKSNLLTQYETEEGFRKYLEGLEEELSGIDDGERAWKFYLWGSYFQTTTGLLSENMRAMVVDFFDRHQNKKNGMWSQELHYHSTNAVHKICSVYNKIGAELKFAEKIVDSTLEILCWDKKTKPIPNTCDLYNVWSVFPYLYENIRKCANSSEEEKEARCDAIRARVLSGAARAVRTTREQMEDYKRECGSFATRKVFKGTSHGCDTAVPFVTEGDFDGFLLSAHDMPHHLLAALGLLEHEIPSYTEYGRLLYINALRKVSPPVKKKRYTL